MQHLFQFIEGFLAWYDQAFPIGAAIVLGYAIARIPDLFQAIINDAKSST